MASVLKYKLAHELLRGEEVNKRFPGVSLYELIVVLKAVWPPQPLSPRHEAISTW